MNKEIDTMKMVRQIRDLQSKELKGKSLSEKKKYFKKKAEWITKKDNLQKA